LAPLAVEAAGRLPGNAAQHELAQLVLDNSPPAIRVAAANELGHHIRQYGSVLAKEQVKAMEDLYEATDDPKLKNNLALVLGGLSPEPSVTGKRLQGFSPSLAPSPKEK
jgi:hypothetical protein